MQSTFCAYHKHLVKQIYGIVADEMSVLVCDELPPAFACVVTKHAIVVGIKSQVVLGKVLNIIKQKV